MLDFIKADARMMNAAIDIAARFVDRLTDRALKVAAKALGALALRIECYRVGHEWEEWHCLLCFKVQIPAHLRLSVGVSSVRVCKRCEFVEPLPR